MKKNVFWIETGEYQLVMNRLAEARESKTRIDALTCLTLYNRINALSTIYNAGRGWLGAALSVAEILTALYFDTAYPFDANDQSRDRILLSKGHAAAMQYACLAGLGILSVEDLMEYNTRNGPQAHTDLQTRGIETNSGSLGQTLSKGIGLALAGAERVWTILGDGEMQEGQNYEALMTAIHYRLVNVVPIIDCNGIQSDSSVSDIMHVGDMKTILAGFGFDVVVFNGNDMQATVKALDQAARAEQCTALIAETRKAAGISFMESNNTDRRKFKWHGPVKDEETYRRALMDLAETEEAKQIRKIVQRFATGAAGLAKPPTKQLSESVNYGAISTGQAFSQTLFELASIHKNIVALGADLEKPCRLADFAMTHPNQYYEMGIAEQDMVSCASGMALSGKLPFVNTYAAFFRRAFEQVYVNASEGTRIVYAGHYSGLCYATDGKTHQCTGDIAMMRSIPGMRVFYPSTPEETMAILKWYVEDSPNGPMYIRLHRTAASDPNGRGCKGGVENHGMKTPPHLFTPGEGVPLRQSDSSWCIVTSGPHMTGYCADAVEQLGFDGQEIDLYSQPCLRYSSKLFYEQLSRYEHLIIVEEHIDAGGLMDEISTGLASLNEAGSTRLVPRLYHKSVHDFTFSSREPEGLYEHFELCAHNIRQYVEGLMRPGRL